jgi:hypothetical protein
LNARWAFKPTAYGYEPSETDASKANEQYAKKFGYTVMSEASQTLALQRGCCLMLQCFFKQCLLNAFQAGKTA